MQTKPAKWPHCHLEYICIFITLKVFMLSTERGYGCCNSSLKRSNETKQKQKKMKGKERLPDPRVCREVS